MDGSELRAARETRGHTQQGFADWLNGQLGRRYDKNRVSRWETGGERIPQPVAELLRSRPVRPREKASILALSNQKGGVGKTTVTVNLATALGQRGYRVLLVDIDPQASATVHLGISQADITQAGKTTFHVMLKDQPVAEAAVPVADGRFHLLSSTILLSAAETELIAEPMGTLVLKEKLAGVAELYDYILIDCPPHLGMLTLNALAAAHSVLVPVQTEVLALMGVPLLLDTISKVRRRGNPDLKLLGILPTMYSARLTQDRATLADLTTQFGSQTRVFQPVPRSTLFPQSVAAGQPLLEVVRDEALVAPFRDIVNAIIESEQSKNSSQEAGSHGQQV
jgi:chromosome partitioning protein